jgi:hypothetical protein
MYQIADFRSQLILIGKKNLNYPTLVAELDTIAAELDADTTAHDLTIARPPPALKPGASQTPFTNEVLLLVNRGRGGNLANNDMADAITGALGLIEPPVNIDAPFVTGTGAVGSVLSCTMGNWAYSPTGYGYQWTRNGANIAGATASTRLLAAADAGTNVACPVTATNAAGSTTVNSNAVAVATILG